MALSCFSNKLFILLTTLLTSTSASSLLSIKDGSNYSKVQTSFVLRSDVHMTLEEQHFVADCLKHSFDLAAFNLDNSEMKQADPNNSLRFPTLINRELNGVGSEDTTTTTNAFKWIINWDLHSSSTCSRCHLDTLLPSKLHASWEIEFCEVLRHGAFDIFHDVENCQIDGPHPHGSTEASRGETKGTQSKIETTEGSTLDSSVLADAAGKVNKIAKVTGNQKIVFNARASFSLPRDEETTDKEQEFINNALRDSYDEIHDEDDIFMESAKLKQHFNIPHKAKPPSVVATSMANKKSYNPDKWMNFTYVWGWEVSGVCRLCFGGFLARGIEFEANPKNLKGKRKEQKRWEDLFCDKIRAGPFEKFKKVKRCFITIYKED